MYELFSRLDQRYTKICAYAGVTVVLTYAACMLLRASSPVFETAWSLIRAVVEPLVYGVGLSYVLNPLVSRVMGLLKRRVLANVEDEGYCHYISVVVTLLLIALVLVGLGAIVVLMINHSLAGFSFRTLSDIADNAQGDLLKLLTAAQSQLAEWGLISAKSESTIIDTFSDLSDTASTAVFAVVFAVYFLFDGARVTSYLGRVARVVLGGRDVDPAPVLADIDHVFAGYFRGQGIDALVVGILASVSLTIAGVPYGPLIGLLAGIGNLIPYVGGFVGFGSIALVCIADANWSRLFVGLIVMAVVMFVDANVINPRLLSENVEVHPILVVIALIAGGAIGGLAGMLVAVPTVAYLKLQVDRWMEAHEDLADEPEAAEPSEVAE